MKWIIKVIVLLFLVVVLPIIIILIGSLAYGGVVEAVKYFQKK